MAKQLALGGRRYWILSEPDGGGWKARVIEILDAAGTCSGPIGIEATAETRAAADDAAERNLRRAARAGN